MVSFVEKMAEDMSPTKAIIQWTCDSTFSIISSSSIKSGILDVGETVEAYYRKKKFIRAL